MRNRAGRLSNQLRERNAAHRETRYNGRGRSQAHRRSVTRQSNGTKTDCRSSGTLLSLRGRPRRPTARPPPNRAWAMYLCRD